MKEEAAKYVQGNRADYNFGGLAARSLIESMSTTRRVWQVRSPDRGRFLRPTLTSCHDFTCLRPI